MGATRASLAASNDSSGPADTTRASMATVPTRPVDWPDSHGFLPPSPSPQSPSCILSKEPVLRHVRAYNGHDADFTAALSQYVSFLATTRVSADGKDIFSAKTILFVFAVTSISTKCSRPGEVLAKLHWCCAGRLADKSVGPSEKATHWKCGRPPRSAMEGEATP